MDNRAKLIAALGPFATAGADPPVYEGLWSQTPQECRAPETRANAMISADSRRRRIRMATHVLGPCSMAAYAASIIHRTTSVDGVNVLYREAGLAHAPPLLLLHDFSHVLAHVPQAKRRAVRT
jgi:hypothetical protein